MSEDRSTSHFKTSKSKILEAPLDSFESPLEYLLEDSGEVGFESDNDEDDFEIDIDDADIGEMDDIETGEPDDNDIDDVLYIVPEKALPQQADIEFWIDEATDRIEYSVELGDLIFNEKVENERYYALKSLAEFLIDKQVRFLRSEDITAAYENLKSYKNDDFLDFHNANHPYLKKEKDKSWASRAIKNKYIQAPFSMRLIPAIDFFDKHWEYAMNLKIAIDYHILMGAEYPLAASEQALILENIFRKKISQDYIKRSIWDILRPFYEKSDWAKIRLKGGQGSSTHRHDDAYLQEIVSHVIKRMNPFID